MRKKNAEVFILWQLKRQVVKIKMYSKTHLNNKVFDEYFIISYRFLWSVKVSYASGISYSQIKAENFLNAFLYTTVTLWNNKLSLIKFILRGRKKLND